MRHFRESIFLAACAAVCMILGMAAQAQISSFKHIILIVQENRTPDDLFQGLCVPPYGTSTSCSATPTGSQYDIQTSNWLNKYADTGVTQPFGEALANTYDLGHSHTNFLGSCDLNSAGACQMDGAGGNICIPNGSTTCPTTPEYAYVSNTKENLDPYLSMVTQYGWANYMFQTNEGPSFPAHQFLFGGTSAPSAADDAIGTFAAENLQPSAADSTGGCIANSITTVELITTAGETSSMYPCFEHQTLADLLESDDISWKYYTLSSGSIWTAPTAIDHICVPSQPYSGTCTGSEYTDNVVVGPAEVLTDIGRCTLPSMSWVIPLVENSDHPGSNTGGGPAWVASVVNAIGNNKKCANGETYWDDTVIMVVWDDWGGWYDHEAPTFLTYPEGDYQYGFRVPFVVISAYTAEGYVDNERNDFGSILRFIEQNFGIPEGELGFADARSTTDLTDFFNLTQQARVFTTIPAALDADYFIHQKPSPTLHDND
jgi:phospholipase C